MGQRKLQRRCRQWNVVGGADGLQLPNPVDDLRWRWPVIVVGACEPLDQNAGIERTADDDPDAPPQAERQEAVQGGLFQQGVATGQQEDVEVAMAQRLFAGLMLVYAQPDGPDRAAVTQFPHGPIAALEELAEPGGVILAMGAATQVVGQQYIDAVAAQALQAFFARAHHRVIAVVEDRLERRGVDEAVPLARAGVGGNQQAADLAGDDDVGTAGQGLAQPRLAQAKAVVGRGVEIAEAGVEGCRDGCRRLGVAHRGVEIADRSAAESQRRQARNHRFARSAIRWRRAHCVRPGLLYVKNVSLIKSRKRSDLSTWRFRPLVLRPGFPPDRPSPPR